MPTQAEPRWQLRLLGAVEATAVALGGPAPVCWPSRAVVTLLARLALAPSRAHPREELVDLLWPDAALAVGRNRLRQALSTRKALCLSHQAPTLRPGTVDCDVLRFEAALHAGDLAAARALYPGELMPGFYDDWVLLARQHLANLAERLAGALPLPAALPGLATAPASAGSGLVPPPTGLPSYWSRPFGADHTAAALLALVQAHRLVTVHGSGGSGKTRLAVAVAAAAGASFERLAFVPLVYCNTAAQALEALADTLQLGTPGGQPDQHTVLQRISAALAGRRVLLVLDNLEQLPVATSSDPA